eukprot:CAMPEP_0197847986 /NCGR_PEP_ID=MMETSP1438-20131217/7702_1 /TAXON_ID=1461541 /ORGANISM="Pterosperma sp., Strain CCMP1384" /LENGTH=471 /DNA_ID=CAMNT_0043460087 /DNA_START=182 /DNA_END=1594 /DNA_ORIENTATION=-
MNRVGLSSRAGPSKAVFNPLKIRSTRLPQKLSGVKSVSHSRRTLKVSAVLSVPPNDKGMQMIPEGTPTWGPGTPEYVAEWRRNLDLKAWGSEMRALERELKQNQDQEDVKHMKWVLTAANVCYFAGLALAGVCNPMSGNPIAAILMSTAIFARWTMVGHHVSHGGYNGQQVEDDGTLGRWHRKSFAKGVQRRVVDWLDWMLPEAWDVEHNNLHHYKLGEAGDPDLVERNLESIRDSGMPYWMRYAQVAGLALIWKWYYYAPNTLKEMLAFNKAKRDKNSKLAPVENPFEATGTHPASMEWVVKRLITKGDWKPMAAMMKIFAPPFLYTYVLAPIPFFLFGGVQMGCIVLANMFLADIITNIHSFIVITTNHCGKDVYRFETTVKPKSDEFYLRAVIGSVNYRTAATTPFHPKDKPAGPLGEINDFMHGYLNYQIEHHMFPDLSMKSYQKAMPRVKEACERHGIPYVQESVW